MRAKLSARAAACLLFSRGSSIHTKSFPIVFGPSRKSTMTLLAAFAAKVSSFDVHATDPQLSLPPDSAFTHREGTTARSSHGCIELASTYPPRRPQNLPCVFLVDPCAHSMHHISFFYVLFVCFVFFFANMNHIFPAHPMDLVTTMTLELSITDRVFLDLMATLPPPSVLCMSTYQLEIPPCQPSPIPSHLLCPRRSVVHSIAHCLHDVQSSAHMSRCTESAAINTCRSGRRLWLAQCASILAWASDGAGHVCSFSNARLRNTNGETHFKHDTPYRSQDTRARWHSTQRIID